MKTVSNTAQRFSVVGDSLADMVAWLAATPKRWSVNSSRSNSATASWDLGLGYDRAISMAATGWSEGATAMDATLSAVIPSNGRIHKVRYDVAGEQADIGRYLGGDPLHMRRRGDSVAKRPIVTLVVNIAANCGIDAKAKANYGAAVVAVVDRLEAAGRRVEVYAAEATSDGSARFFMAWLVKAAGEQMDLGALAYSVAHPAVHRRIGFAVKERSSLRNDAGYGAPAELSPADMADVEPDALAIQGVNRIADFCTTVNGAVKAVAKQINTAAGETLVEVD